MHLGNGVAVEFANGNWIYLTCPIWVHEKANFHSNYIYYALDLLSFEIWMK